MPTNPSLFTTRGTSGERTDDVLAWGGTELPLFPQNSLHMERPSPEFSQFAGFPAPFLPKHLSSLFSSWLARNPNLSKLLPPAPLPPFSFNRHQCRLLERVLHNLDYSVIELTETFKILPYKVQSTPPGPPSPRRSDSKSLSDVKRGLAHIVRLQRMGYRLLDDCRESLFSPTAIKVLDDTKAFEAIFAELDLWWSDMWSILEHILVDYGAQSSGGQHLPEFSGNFWKCFLEIAANKDREESYTELQEMVNTMLNRCPTDEVSLRTLKRARLLCGKLGYFSLVDSMHVHPSELERGRFLGKGSYGEVHEVLWCGEKYAMKTFETADRETFLQEAEIHASLQHPHIVKMICHSSNKVENTCCLVMELMDENLSTLISKAKETPYYNGSPFKPFIAVRILLQIAEAMYYLHSKDIMHRDLKAENVLVCLSSSIDPFMQGDFQVKVADFGQAKSKASSSGMNTSKVGTLYWRAPEVLSNEETSRYTFKADVYSFAFTCYEVLTGKAPFCHYDPKYLYDKIKKGERPDIPDFVHSPLANLIKQCWRNDPTLRPTFKEIRSRLQKYLIDASGYEWI